MFRTFIVGAVLAVALTFSASASTQQDRFGTATEAKAMLEKAVVAV
jgi:hypothetical protein